jgi:hypothetical protein
MGGSQGNNNRDDVAVALLLVLLGAALALLGDRFLEHKRDKRNLAQWLRILRDEIHTIEDEAARRAALPPAGGLRNEPPLPTEAWRAVIISGGLANVKRRETLIALYRGVDAANYLVSQVPTYLAIANLASDPDVREAFAAEAQRVASAPFGEIAPLVRPAIEALSEGA